MGRKPDLDPVPCRSLVSATCASMFLSQMVIISAGPCEVIGQRETESQVIDAERGNHTGSSWVRDHIGKLLVSGSRLGMDVEGGFWAFQQVQCLGFL